MLLFFFSCPGPLSHSWNKEELRNIDNSQKSIKSSTKHCNAKNFHMLWRVLGYILFFFTNFSQGCFLSCLNFFILKILILYKLLLKWKKTCYTKFFFVKILISFVKLLNTSLHEYSLFSVMYNKSFYWQ